MYTIDEKYFKVKCMLKNLECKIGFVTKIKYNLMIAKIL